MLDELFKEYISSGSIVEVYTNPDDTNSFNLGRILYFDSHFCVISLYCTRGYFDGFMLYEKDKVLSIKSDSKYIKKMIRIIDHYKIECDPINIKGDNLLISYLEFIKSEGRVAEIEICNSGLVDAQGIIERVNGDMCIIEEIDDFGECKGINNIPLCNITEVSFCSQRTKIVEFLYKESSINK